MSHPYYIVMLTVGKKKHKKNIQKLKAGVIYKLGLLFWIMPKGEDWACWMVNSNARQVKYEPYARLSSSLSLDGAW